MNKNQIQIKAPFVNKELCAAHRAAIDEKFKANDKALQLQAENNRVHFEKLNDAYGKAVADRQMFVRGDVYSVEHKILKKRVDDLDGKISKVIAAGALCVLGVGIVLAVLDFIFRATK
jgi:hypothetical protein